MVLAFRTSTEAVSLPPLLLLPQPVKHATQNMTAKRMDTILLMFACIFYISCQSDSKKQRACDPKWYRRLSCKHTKKTVDSAPHTRYVTVLRLLSAVPASSRRQSRNRFGGAAFLPRPLAGVYHGVLIRSATSIRYCILLFFYGVIVMQNSAVVNPFHSFLAFDEKNEQCLDFFVRFAEALRAQGSLPPLPYRCR